MAIWAAPRVNAGAWFALAVAAPLALLAVGAAASRTGEARAAGVWAATLLVPAIFLAVKALERRWTDAPPADDGREAALTHAFALTTGQATGLLFVVAAGARFTGEAIALALGMAGVPLTLAVAAELWRRVIPPLGAKAERELPAARNWTLEWIEAQRPASRPAPVMAIRPRPGASRVVLRVTPAEADEDWMRRGQRRAAERRLHAALNGAQNGSGAMSGGIQPWRAAGENSVSRLQ